MIECIEDKWVLTIKKDILEEYVYDIFLVENWLIYHYFDEVVAYIIYDNLPFYGCIEKNVVGMNSQEFYLNEPTKFTILFMIGHEKKFL
jgi:hypothetical protein